jgi:hypothetical protein
MEVSYISSHWWERDAVADVFCRIAVENIFACNLRSHLEIYYRNTQMRQYVLQRISENFVYSQSSQDRSGYSAFCLQQRNYG